MIKNILVAILLCAMSAAQVDSKSTVPLPPKHKSHDTRTWVIAVTSISVGLLGGAAIAIIQNKNNSCPTVINGYPYSGTPPCPNPATYDPGNKKH